jgi:hypothetical protein
MMRKKPLVGAMTGVLAVGAASVAIAGTNQGVSFDSTTTSKKPNTSTGLITHIKGAPVLDQAAGTYKAARTVIVQFPPGTKINSKAVKQCVASPSDFQTKGKGACPAASKIGSGSAEAITGLGAGIDPVGENVTAFNTKKGIYFLLTPAGTVGQTAVLTAKWSGAGAASARSAAAGPKLTTVVPPFPLPGGAGEAALTKFDLTVKSHGKGKKAYSTTPRTCPKSGKWKLSATFKYDGGQTIVVQDDSPCKK